MVLAAVLLTLGAGICLFHQDDHGTAGHLAHDLCLGMLAVSLAIMPLVGLLALGWTPSPPRAAAYVVARNTPDPPPRPPRFR